MGTPLLRIQGLSKSFPGVRALSDVGFTIGYGEVHALLGENGAGKSTLLKILSGALKRDKGTIDFADQPYEIDTPIQANDAGIVTIYQEFNLIPPLSIAENIYSGREPTKGIFINRKLMLENTQAVLDRMGLDLDPRRIVSSLSVAEQQMVEIARALSMASKLIIMDEPTSALSEAEVEVLMNIIRTIRAEGISMIFVTHRLKEVSEICDRYTVLRDGNFIESGSIGDVDERDIIKLMVGREVNALFQRREYVAAENDDQPIALRVSGLENVFHLNDVNVTRIKDAGFEVRRGEILGIAGLVGSGRTEMARMIFGADERAAGTIEVFGEAVDIKSPMDAIDAGIGMVPEDRKQQGCFLELSVAANMGVVALKSLCSGLGFVDRTKESEMISEFGSKLGVKMSSDRQKIGNLSGGNQQKVIVARWLAANPKILIVDEPTRGIDVGAKSQIHEILFDLANQGLAVIVISSELPELLCVSDRIVTMCEGSSGKILNTVDATEEILMRRMSGL